MMEMRIHFPGNKKVAADFNGFTVMTDQPVEAGGDGSAPSPFDLFLASIGTCAGIFVVGFCRQRQIPTEGIELIQKVEWNGSKRLASKVAIEIRLPKDFPEKYRDSLVNAVSLCTVKRNIYEPPEFTVTTKIV